MGMERIRRANGDTGYAEGRRQQGDRIELHASKRQNTQKSDQKGMRTCMGIAKSVGDRRNNRHTIIERERYRKRVVVITS